MTDNFDKIIPLLNFDDPDRFYHLQIIQRKKDHGNRKVSGTNNNSRLIRSYNVHSLSYLSFIKPEIIELCKVFNARAGINLNRRSYKTLGMKMVKNVISNIENGNEDKIYKSWDSVCGKYSAEKEKRWILDIDERGRATNDIILFAERECRPEGEKFIAFIPSKNGYHLIMKPFDLKKFSEKFPDVDIHKNNPTNLYIP